MNEQSSTKTPDILAQESEPCGAVLVCGGGVAGIQASLDLSAAGFRVYVVEESPTVGGSMARLDKTFPTGDCATCIISPKLVEFTRDHNIEVFTMTDVKEIEGDAGHFRVQLRQRPRSVDESKCTGCGDCWSQCPVRNHPQETPSFAPSTSLSEDEQVLLDEVLDRYEGDRAPLLQVLQDLNEENGYLPRPILEALAVRLETPLSEIYRVASFYNVFNLAPVGRHLIEICLGTACFVRGSGLLLEHLERELNVTDGGTDAEGRFTLKTVRCIGCCALAPAVRIDGVTFGQVQLESLSGLLETFE